MSDTDTKQSISVSIPTLSDGADIWRLAKATGTLDLNASYAYLLWCRDFANTSIVAKVDDTLVGFITGYLRQEAPTTLMIWQVATHEQMRGRGIAATMLNQLFDRCEQAHGVSRLETTITADNEASIKLFTRFGQNRDMTVNREPLLTSELFPDAHDTEYLYRIG